ncbi:MAG: hypothetical protein WCF65_07565 [Parachlamydiaceae bacterium]
MSSIVSSDPSSSLVVAHLSSAGSTARTIASLDAEATALRGGVDAIDFDSRVMEIAEAMLEEQSIALQQLKSRLEGTILEQDRAIVQLNGEIRTLEANIITQRAQCTALTTSIANLRGHHSTVLMDLRTKITSRQNVEQQTTLQLAPWKQRLAELAVVQDYAGKFLQALGTSAHHRLAWIADYEEYCKQGPLYRR